ncbi:hypothetical protein FYJ91_18725 [Sphingomonas montanisoli]|uniref:Uncharacterized protein n=1 Tax=Sphingomonas montanisoli TaxID=2606412 RepID=A0A5D9BZM1_9SPHN|nr:hypothetical protein FYJ91_18725 [Sphingomonas montanisoli]
MPVPGLIGPGGVADTGLLPNVGNPSNPGPLGPVLVQAGNAVLGVESQTPTLVQAVDNAVPGSVPIVGTVAQVIKSTGQALVETGNGQQFLVDGLTGAVGQAVSLNVLGKDILPAGANPLVGVSLASATQNAGRLATVGVDAAGNLVNAVVTPLGAGNGAVGGNLPGTLAPVTNGLGQVAGVTAGTTQVLGSAGVTPAVGVSVLSPTQTAGSLATVGVGAGGNLVTAAVGPVAGAGAGAAVPASAVVAPVQQVVQTVTGALPSGAIPANGLATVQVGNATLLDGGSNPAIGASVLSPTQATGSAVTAGVASAGNLVTGTVGNVLGAVQGTVTAVAAPVTNAASPAGVGAVPVQGLVQGLLGRSGGR